MSGHMNREAFETIVKQCIGWLHMASATATYEGHRIRDARECARIDYGSRGERYLRNDINCTCQGDLPSPASDAGFIEQIVADAARCYYDNPKALVQLANDWEAEAEQSGSDGAKAMRYCAAQLKRWVRTTTGDRV